MCKVLFVVINEQTAKTFLPIHQELVKANNVDVGYIGTGRVCCGKDDADPSEAMAKFGMRHTSLSAYGTNSIVEILKREKPDVVITESDQEFMRRAFVYASNGLGIPVVFLQMGISNRMVHMFGIATKRTIYRLTHYFFNILHRYYYLLRTIIALRWSPARILGMVLKDIWVAFTTDDARSKFGYFIAVTSCSWEKQEFVERGVNPENIFVTGSPMVNLASQMQGSHNGKLREEFGIGENDKVILLLTSALVEHGRWTPDRRRIFVNAVLDTISPLLSDGVKLVIKIHPVESIKPYEEILMGRKEKVVLRKDLVLRDILNESDVVIVGGYSMATLDATAMRKPVVLLNVFGEIHEQPFVEMGIAVGVYDLDDLRPTVEGLLYKQMDRDEAMRKIELFYDSNKELVDGKAASRIVDLILKLAREHCKEKSRVN